MAMFIGVGALSLGAASSVINSISTLTLNIYTLSTNIRLSKSIFHNEIKDVLIRTDLDASLKLLQSIIIEIPQYYPVENVSIIIALKNMQEIIQYVECELKNIYEQMKYNKNIYLFKNIRSYDFKLELRKLEAYIQVMEKRKENLFKTLDLFKNCQKINNPNTKLLMIAQVENSIYEIDDESTVM
jgi:hypothetical protein